MIQHYASLLNKEMADADFAFYGTTLHGIPENRPRWKRAVGAVNGSLGEAVGKLYVEKHFPPEAKARMDRMVENVIAAYRQSFRKLHVDEPGDQAEGPGQAGHLQPEDRLSEEMARLLGARNPPRRPDRQRARAATFEWNRELAKLGKPVDRDEWHMTPQTVNAYYNPSMNEIVFPAAILQPPFFNRAADDAVNYGGIGAVIGHEIGHGFDDQGSKWDGAGNLRRLVDAGRPRRVRQARRGAGGAVRPLRAAARLQGQRPADARREHRRPVPA